MAKGNSTLLKIVSILFIICGLVGLVGGGFLLFVFIGGVAAVFSGGLGIIIVIAGLISCLGSLLMLVAGVRGLNGRPARGIVTLILICGVIGLIGAILGIKEDYSNGYCIINIVLPILYLFGAK